MKIDTRKLAMSATTKALQIRKKVGVAAFDPVSIFDVVDQMGVELRISDIPSMEGVYLLGKKPTIILSSLRPKGRQAFTCAHELGHHVFSHGEKFDQLINHSKMNRSYDSDEFVADSFAGILLMPKTAIINAFKVRNQLPETAPCQEIYNISTYLGVGYTTLINHMYYALKMISRNRLQELLKVQVSRIRRGILNNECKENLIVVDANWHGRAVDMERSDICLLPSSYRIESEHLEIIEKNDIRVVARAISSGLGRLEDNDSNWSAFIRVSKKGFVGRAKFRFQEDG